MKKGGKRENAGRKKGGKNESTITREAALKHFNDRVAKSTDALFNAAKLLAMGTTYIYRLDEEERGGAKNKYTIKVPVLVTDPEEIATAIDMLEGNGNGDGEYYYATTKEPDIRAIDSLLNRAHGRPKESIEHSGEIKGLVGLVTSLNNETTRHNQESTQEEDE